MVTSSHTNGKVFYKSYLDTQTNCIYSNWTGFVNVENVKTGCMAGLAVLKENECAYVINDNSDLEGLWQQANEWIQTVWMPQAVDAGLRYLAHVVSKDIFGKLSAQDLEKKSVGILSMRLFETLQQAEQWVKESQLKDNSVV